jgi:membrane-bound ClpP family serine protease
VKTILFGMAIIFAGIGFILYNISNPGSGFADFGLCVVIFGVFIAALSGLSSVLSKNKDNN